MSFSVAQPTTYRCANARSFAWVQSIQVKTEVDGIVILPGNSDGLLHHRGDAILINIRHGEDMHVMATEQILLASVKSARGNDNNVLFTDFGCPPADICETTITQPGQGGKDHPMNVAGWRGFFRIEIGVGVDPYHANILMFRRRATDCAQCDAMVTAQYERKFVCT